MRNKLKRIDLQLAEIKVEVTTVVRKQSDLQDMRKKIIEQIILNEKLLQEGQWEFRVHKHPFLYCANDEEFPKLRKLVNREGLYDSLQVGPAVLSFDDGEVYLSSYGKSLEEFSEFLTEYGIEVELIAVDTMIGKLEIELDFYREMKVKFIGE